MSAVAFPTLIPVYVTRLGARYGLHVLECPYCGSDHWLPFASSRGCNWNRIVRWSHDGERVMLWCDAEQRNYWPHRLALQWDSTRVQAVIR